MNEPVSASVKVKRPLWWRIVRGVLLIGAGLFVLAVIVLSAWNLRVSRQLRAELQKIHDAGEPLTFAQREAEIPQIQESQNAARFYHAARNLMVDEAQIRELYEQHNEQFTIFYFEEIDQTEFLSMYKPDSEWQNRTQSILEANQIALEMVDRGGELPDCQGVFLGRYGHVSRVREILPFISLSRLLSLRTLKFVADNQPDRAVDSVISTFRLIRIHNNQPSIFILYATKFINLATSYSDIPFILQFTNPSDESLERLQNALTWWVGPLDIHEVLIDSRIYAIEYMGLDQFFSEMFFGNLILGSPHMRWHFNRKWPDLSFFWPFRKQAAVDYLREMSVLIEAVQNSEPIPKRLPGTGEEPSFWVKRYLPEDDLPYDNERIYRLKNNLNYYAIIRRCTLVAVMIERYRLANDGRLPESLADLVPAFIDQLPLDPFTDADLLYRYDDTGYTVYSVGRNLQDNGGNVTPAKYVTRQRFAFRMGRDLDQGIHIKFIKE